MNQDHSSPVKGEAASHKGMQETVSAVGYRFVSTAHDNRSCIMSNLTCPALRLFWRGDDLGSESFVR